jgi:protein SCO1/2
MRHLILLLALIAAPATAALNPADLSGVGATPAAGASLPVGLAFVDQAGKPYRLTEAPMPTVLIFADYSCRHICGPGVTLTAGALHDAGLKPGRDYRMIVVGMDQDGPALARTLVAERLKGLPAEASALTLLTGAPPVIARAEAALGYHAVYDADADQFAHDAAIYVFGPSGALSALLPETASTAPQLATAIAGAHRCTPYQPPAFKTANSLAGKINAICYGLASAHGIYATPIVVGLRVGAVLICLALALFLFGSLRRHRKTADAA